MCRNLSIFFVNTFGNSLSKVINKDSLLREAHICLYPADRKDTLFDHYKVVAFTAQLNGKIFEITGKDFSNELLAAIRNAQNGDVLTISSVNGFNEAIS